MTRPRFLGIVGAVIGLMSMDTPADLRDFGASRRREQRRISFNEHNGMNGGGGNGLHDGPCPAQYARRSAAGRAKHRARVRGHSN